MSDIIPDTSCGEMVDELKQRGVSFPVGGFAPGRYNVVCRSCARRFDGAKGSFACLPCALTKAIAAAGDVEAARTEGREAGYRLAVDDLVAAAGRRAGGADNKDEQAKEA